MIELAGKTHVHYLPDQNDSVVYGRSRFAEITITMKNGSKIHSKADKTKWSAPDEASDMELGQKYRKLIAEYLSPEQRDQLEAKIIALESLSDVSEIVDLTVPHP